MRRALLMAALSFALAAHAQDDEHRLVPPLPKVAPQMTGAQLLRKLSSGHSAEVAGYLQGIEDATGDRDWCRSEHQPSRAELHAALIDGLRKLPTAERRQNAARLAVRIWQEKWFCPTVGGCCDD